MIRSGLRLLLEQQPDFKVKAEADNGREAVELIVKHHEGRRKAFILKNAAEADLIRAMRSVSEGKSFFSPVISKMLLEAAATHPRRRW